MYQTRGNKLLYIGKFSNRLIQALLATIYSFFLPVHQLISVKGPWNSWEWSTAWNENNFWWILTIFPIFSLKKPKCFLTLFFACTVAYYFSNLYWILPSLDINLTEILLIHAKTNKISIKLEKFKEIATKNSTGLVFRSLENRPLESCFQKNSKN